MMQEVCPLQRLPAYPVAPPAGERHGTPAERLLAAQQRARQTQQSRPHTLFATGPKQVPQSGPPLEPGPSAGAFAPPPGQPPAMPPNAGTSMHVTVMMIDHVIVQLCLRMHDPVTVRSQGAELAPILLSLSRARTCKNGQSLSVVSH